MKLIHSFFSVLLTGWAMSGHAQALKLSVKVIYFSFCQPFYPDVFSFVGSWNIWTYTHACWFLKNNRDLLFCAIVFYRGSV